MPDRSQRPAPLDVALAMVAAVPAALAFAALLGLGMHRRAAPTLVVVASSLLLFGPPAAAALSAGRHRGRRLLAGILVWSVVVLLGLPVYFPGERRDAVASGLSVLRLGDGWDRVARRVAEGLPDEPVLAEPEVSLATPATVAAPPPPPALEDHQIALPYEGDGRRLSVPVVFSHGDREVEVWMMLDTGATYTTLPGDILATLGLLPGPDAPVLTLHTANGERDAAFVVADRVWLGDLALDGVAIARCDACPSGDNAGLLGLNVSGGYNLSIDADRQEVVFTERPGHDQVLDVSPFAETSARFTRFPGGRVEVEVSVRNQAPRPIATAIAEVRCADGDGAWEIVVHDVPPGRERSSRHRLPAHDRCEGYRVQLAGASW